MAGLLGAISFPVLERIPLFGDVAVSPHGIGIAVGFLLGAILFTRRAEKRGLGHAPVPNIPEAVQDILVRAAIGAIIGARLFYVLTHLDQFADEPLRVFAAWEGGLTFLGGIAGAVLLAIPHARRQGYRLTMLLDSAAPGIALGLAVGRLGDLMIGDHIGSPTDFPLAWRCTGNYWMRDTNSFGLVEPLPYPAGLDAPTAGCFDVAVHHTALYDFGATVIVLGVLLLLERRKAFDGFFMAAWVYLYGALRFTSDFARQDRVWLGLTGSQWAIVGACLAVTGYLAIRRPWEHLRWAWDLEFDHPWIVKPAEDTDSGDVGAASPGSVPSLESLDSEDDVDRDDDRDERLSVGEALLQALVDDDEPPPPPVDLDQLGASRAADPGDAVPADEVVAAARGEGTSGQDAATDLAATTPADPVSEASVASPDDPDDPDGHDEVVGMRDPAGSEGPSGPEEPGTGESGTGKSGPEESGTGESGTEESGTEEPGTDESGTEDAGDAEDEDEDEDDEEDEAEPPPPLVRRWQPPTLAEYEALRGGATPEPDSPTGDEPTLPAGTATAPVEGEDDPAERALPGDSPSGASDEPASEESGPSDQPVTPTGHEPDPVEQALPGDSPSAASDEPRPADEPATADEPVTSDAAEPDARVEPAATEAAALAEPAAPEAPPPAEPTEVQPVAPTEPTEPLADPAATEATSPADPAPTEATSPADPAEPTEPIEPEPTEPAEPPVSPFATPPPPPPPSDRPRRMSSRRRPEPPAGA